LSCCRSGRRCLGNAADSGSCTLTTASGAGSEGEGEGGSIGDSGVDRAGGVEAGILISQLTANGCMLWVNEVERSLEILMPGTFSPTTLKSWTDLRVKRTSIYNVFSQTKSKGVIVDGKVMTALAKEGYLPLEQYIRTAARVSSLLCTSPPTAGMSQLLWETLGRIDNKQLHMGCQIEFCARLLNELEHAATCAEIRMSTCARVQYSR